MNYLKLTVLFTLAGFASFGLAALSGRGLPESSKYQFPESVIRHYVAGHNGLQSSLPATAHIEKTADEMNGVEVLNLESTATDINVVLTDDLNLSVDATVHTAKESEPVTLVRDGDRILNIHTNEGNTSLKPSDILTGTWNINFGEEEEAPRLTVHVPKSVRQIRVRTISGETHIENGPKPDEAGQRKDGLASVELGLESKSGDFFLDAKNLGPVVVDTVSGETRSKTPLQKLEHKSVSGDLNLKFLPTTASIRSETVSGDVFLHYPSAPSAKLRFKTTSGESKITIAGQLVSEGSGQQELTLGKGEGSVQLTSVSGDLNLLQKEQPEGEDSSSEESEN